MFDSHLESLKLCSSSSEKVNESERLEEEKVVSGDYKEVPTQLEDYILKDSLYTNSREKNFGIKTAQFEANFDTFQPRSPEISVQRRDSPTREKLRIANENLNSIRKSLSPARTNNLSDHDRISDIGDSPEEEFCTEYRRARNFHQNKDTSKVSEIKSEINNLMEKMDNASKSIFEAYDFKDTARPLDFNQETENINQTDPVDSLREIEPADPVLLSSNLNPHDGKAVCIEPKSFIPQPHPQSENHPPNITSIPHPPIDSEKEAQIQLLQLEFQISKSQKHLSHLISAYKTLQNPSNPPQTSKIIPTPSPPLPTQKPHPVPHLDPKSLQKQLKTSQKTIKTLTAKNSTLIATIKQQEKNKRAFESQKRVMESLKKKEKKFREEMRTKVRSRRDL
ncbi:unnamed protein product [Moneuplotes crassus]|uniref:Uncharacterized protein n=1 Tax=Euplotes crassus TaxID=5936 RepID=A0AAD1X9B3_EUPCR|nr:unnamed protein product [Moneuplotes crassus]